MSGILGTDLRRRNLILLLGICILAWLPGFFTLPPLDRDESRFAQATKQMLETGDFVQINLGQGPRYEKPVGIYWLQAAATAALGAGPHDRIWTYRVPSFLGALAAVAVTFLIAEAVAGAEAGFFAGLLLGFSLLLMSEARIAKTDAVLLASVTATQYVLMRAYLAARARRTPLSSGLALAGWAAFGAGLLVKGPVVALVAGATLIVLSALDREWGWLKALRPGRGVLLVLLMVLPWAIAIGVESHGAFYQKSLGQDFAMKLAGDQDAHGAPPGYYTLLVNLTFWPGTLAMLPGLALGFARRKEPAIRFLLVWAAATWVMFECAPTKLPHYVLPAYPALAALSALWLTDDAEAGRLARIAAVAAAILFALVGLVLAAFLIWAPERFGTGSPWWLYGWAGLGAGLVLGSLRPLARGGRKRAMAIAACAAIVLYAGAGIATAPRLDDIWLSPRMAEAVARQARAHDPPVITAGYAEPSIVFLLGTRTKLDDSGADAARAASLQGGLVLVAREDSDGFLGGLAASGAHADALEEIDGLDYSRGKRAAVTLYRVTPGSR